MGRPAVPGSRTDRFCRLRLVVRGLRVRRCDPTRRVAVHPLDARRGESSQMGAKHGTLPASRLDRGPARRLFSHASAMGAGGETPAKRRYDPETRLVAQRPRDALGRVREHVRHHPPPRPDRRAGAADPETNGRGGWRFESAETTVPKAPSLRNVVYKSNGGKQWNTYNWGGLV